MSIVTDLLARSGVIAAGQYTYKAELLAYGGALSAEHANILAISCYDMTKNMAMEGDMLTALNLQGGDRPPRGWIMRGPDYTVCVVANVFCLIDNHKGSLNKILGFMRQALANSSLDLV